MKTFKYIVCLLVILVSVQNLFAQRRLLDRAKKAVYQLDYEEVVTELDLFLEKNGGTQSNVYLLLSARIYGDPESPNYRPDTAYKIVSRVVYYPSTYNPKMDGVVCKNYQACLDTVQSRKTQYVGDMLRISLASNDAVILKAFIRQYGLHISEVDQATQYLHKIEFEKAQKADKILIYTNYIESYPSSIYIKQAREGIEKLKYERVVRLNTVREYERFLEEYPNSGYLEDVRLKIENVRWQYCLNGKDIGRYKEYLQHYPESSHKDEALKSIEALQWAQIRQINEVPYYRWFMRTYPHSENYQQTGKLIYQLQWAKASVENTIQGYETFIREFPESPEAIISKEQIEFLKQKAESSELPDLENTNSEINE